MKQIVEKKNWSIGDDCLVWLQNWKTKSNLKLCYRGRIVGRNPEQNTFDIFLRDYGRTTKVGNIDLLPDPSQLSTPSNGIWKMGEYRLENHQPIHHSSMQPFIKKSQSCYLKNKFKSNENHAVESDTLEFSALPDVSTISLDENLPETFAVGDGDNPDYDSLAQSGNHHSRVNVDYVDL